jgi:hypothetical protein
MTFHHSQVSFNGTTVVAAELDLADALDLDVAITQGAESLAAGGCEETLDVRRAIAVGDLARNQLALDLHASADGKPSRGVKPRHIVLYVHLSEAAITRTSTLDVARVENRQLTLTAEQVKTWCANPDAQVVVKPVIDLNEHIGVESYEVPDRLAEQTRLVNHTCVFPCCTRPARRCDSDHVIAHVDRGSTCSCNIAPLCRRHHWLKTHSTWTCTVLEPGSFLWSSPHGYQFLRDHTGTADVTPERPPARTADPPHLCCPDCGCLPSLVTRQHPRGDSAPRSPTPAFPSVDGVSQ